MLQSHYFYRHIDSENKVTLSWAVFYTIIVDGKADGQRLTLAAFLVAVENFVPLHTQTGHLDINLPSRIRIFVNAIANSTYLYSRRQYFALCSRAINRWLKHHGLPPSLAILFMDKLAVEWRHHLDAIDLLPRFSFHAVQHLLHWLPIRIVWFIMLITSNFVWPYFVPGCIFKERSIPGRIRNCLNNYLFLLKLHNSAYSMPSPLNPDIFTLVLLPLLQWNVSLIGLQN